MGDKIAARKTAMETGIPVVPGSDGAVETFEQASRVAKDIGYPVLIKASAGGGGKGMKVADSEADLRGAFDIARREAEMNFGNPAVYIEKFLRAPRHIEVQILGDNHGNVVHLGERDCSVQRRHQKLIEEAPSPALNEEQRQEIGEIAASAVRKIGYRSAGTIEFMYENGQFYFIEMNTRLQVEHPVTEAICGMDLVAEMIRVASGSPLGFTQEDVTFTGHAIECRINAENPATFLPSPGKVHSYHVPGGWGIRVDSALYAGYAVPPYYDSMIAKLIVRGSNRNECLMRLRRALEEFVIDGVETTIPLHQRLISEPAFIDGEYDNRWLERLLEKDD